MISFKNIRTLHQSIRMHCEREPGAHCFSLFRGGKWNSYTRREFWEKVEQWASFFAGALPANEQRQGLILFLKTIDVELFSAYIGAMIAGFLPGQISYLTGKTTENEYRRKISHILDSTRPVAVFTDDSNRALFDMEHFSIPIFSPASTAPGPCLAAPSAETRECALVQFSSGSTGLQKGVVLTHAAIIAHMDRYSTFLQLSEADSIVSWLPLYHDMGLIGCFLMPLACGVPFYQFDPFDWVLQPDIFLQAIERFRTTVCFLPNFAYHVLVNKGKPRDLSSMRLFINCSEPARPKAHQLFLETFPSVSPQSLTVCYALAENTFAVSQSMHQNDGSIGKVQRNALSCGKVLPGTSVRIFDAGENGEGEVGIRGECLFKHFADGTRELREGFYLTGDLGFLEDGQLYITGRKKDLIIINGKNVYPQDVEYVASHVEGVYPGRVVAFGIKNDVVGSEELFVLVEPDGSRDAAKLRQEIQKTVYLEIGFPPKKVEVVPHMALVKTSSGKISRSRNKELYREKSFKIL